MRLRRHPPLRRLGLRARLTLTYALGAALLSAFLAVTTFGLTRENLVKQHEDTAVARAFLNATLVNSWSLKSDKDIESLIGSLPTPEGAQPVHRVRWTAGARRTRSTSTATRSPSRCATRWPRATRPACASSTTASPTSRWACPSSGRARHGLLRGGVAGRGPTDPREPGHHPDRGLGHHHGGRRPARLVGGPAGPGPAARRRHRGRGHRRRAARHPPHGRRRPRPRRAGRTVQPHGPGPRGPGRPRRPVRVRGQPRAALAADDAGRVGRGAGEQPRGDARPGPDRARPAVGRRRPLPAARRGPARDLPLRRRGHQAAPRGGAGRRDGHPGGQRARGRRCARPLRRRGQHRGRPGRQASLRPGAGQPARQRRQVRRRRDRP